jgi:HD-GYP domain-containing protein (c-di-GMP phosphodiesterase class II)/CRP-like cAMP-binding protein
MSINHDKIAEIILNTSLFGNLPEKNRIEIAKKMKELSFEPKENIVTYGQMGDSLYLIVEGLVEVLGTDYITGDVFVLAHLGPGDCFGEMSLLTGEKRSASVRTFENTKVLQLDRSSFNELMLSSSQMGLSISKILAQRLGKLNQRFEELKGKQAVLNKMFSAELDIHSEIAVIGRSNAIKKVVEKINEIAAATGVWAIKGQTGTGKSYISRLIHRCGDRISDPYIVMDCSIIKKEFQREKLYGNNKEPGFLKMAHSGTIAFLNAHKIDKLLLENLIEKCQMEHSANSKNYPLFLCIFEDHDALVNQYFPKENVLEVPPISSRKQDIPVIAKKLLERLDKSSHSRPIRLSNDALTRLLEHNWPENLRELESVLERSLVLSKDPIISEDKIIFDLPSAMQDPYLESVKSLAIALDAKDPYTAGHSERVGKYSKLIGKILNLDDDYLEKLYTLALFHDVGKIGVPESILRKQTHLSEEEYAQIQKHPESSMRILQPLTKYVNEIDAVLHHHTHYDGTGYPAGLSGDNIPIGARIISVADTFDAMTTDRPYRKSLPISMAVEEMNRVAGKQLDPKITAAMIKVIEEGKFIN